MSEPAATPPSFPPGTSVHEKRVVIAGAGTLGMVLLIASLSFIFGATMVLFIVFRATGKAEIPAGFPSLPSSLWLSTLVLIASSCTMQWAYKSIQNGNENGLRRGMVITLFLALLFLAFQVFNWLDLYRQLPPSSELRYTTNDPGGHYFAGQYRTFFYIFFYLLTALHAAHVVGGVIPMAVVTAKSFAGKYSRNYFPGVRYSAIYWHFLDIVWIIMFTIILLAH